MTRHLRFPVAAVVSPLAGLAVCTALIVLCGTNPRAALVSLFAGTFTSAYYFGTTLNTAAFLMTAGCGAALAIKSGNMNLGGEGQIYAGGFVAALVLGSPQAVAAKTTAPLIFLAALLASLATGAAMALVSALLKEKRGAAVLLTTFLLSAAALPLIDGLIIASKAQSGQNLLALPYIGVQYRCAQLLAPSPLTLTFFVACALCVAVWGFLRCTYAGRRLAIWGSAPQFARYCGFSSAADTAAVLAVSGALHALTGFFAVCGTYHTCHKDFYVNMGWNALSAALIVGAHPLALIPSSLVLAWLYTSAGRVALTQGFAFDIGGIVQGVVLFAIAIPFAAGSQRAGRNRYAADKTLDSEVAPPKAEPIAEVPR